jgi:hypothetical protein
MLRYWFIVPRPYVNYFLGYKVVICSCFLRSHNTCLCVSRVLLDLSAQKGSYLLTNPFCEVILLKMAKLASSDVQVHISMIICYIFQVSW